MKVSKIIHVTCYSACDEYLLVTFSADQGWYSEPGHISYDGRKSASRS